MGRDARTENLDRDFAIEFLVPCSVNLPQPTFTQRRQDLVGTEEGACSECHRLAETTPPYARQGPNGYDPPNLDGTRRSLNSAEILLLEGGSSCGRTCSWLHSRRAAPSLSRVPSPW